MIYLRKNSSGNLIQSWTVNTFKVAVHIEPCKDWISNLFSLFVIFLFHHRTISQTWRYGFKCLFYVRKFARTVRYVFRTKGSEVLISCGRRFQTILWFSRWYFTSTLGSFIFDLIIVGFILYIYCLIRTLLSFCECHTRSVNKFIFLLVNSRASVLIWVFKFRIFSTRISLVALCFSHILINNILKF